MKRLLAIMLLTVILVCSFAACAESHAPRAQKTSWILGLTQPKEDRIIEKAVKALTEHWKNEEYSGKNAGISKDGYLEIKWTRVVYIKDNIKADHAEQFKGMNCYVEFFVLSDYFGSAPYYSHAGVNECVAVMDNGQYKVVQDPIRMYRSMTYQNDFSPIIESISDRGSDFNQVFYLLK